MTTTYLLYRLAGPNAILRAWTRSRIRRFLVRRARLPVWLVRIRSMLRFMSDPQLQFLRHHQASLSPQLTHRLLARIHGAARCRVGGRRVLYSIFGLRGSLTAVLGPMALNFPLSPKTKGEASLSPNSPHLGEPAHRYWSAGRPPSPTSSLTRRLKGTS